MSVGVFHAFLVYSTTDTEDDQIHDLAGGSNDWWARLDACARTIMECLTKRQKLCRHLQELYTDTYGRLMVLPIKQLTGNLRAFLGSWVGEQLESRPDENVLKVMQAPWNDEKYIPGQSSWFQ